MSGARIVYRPHQDTTREGELAALAAVYRFVLDRQAKKRALHLLTPPDDAKEIKGYQSTTSICE